MKQSIRKSTVDFESLKRVWFTLVLIRLRTVLGSFSVRFPGAAPLARFKVVMRYSVLIIHSHCAVAVSSFIGIRFLI